MTHTSMRAPTRFVASHIGKRDEHKRTSVRTKGDYISHSLRLLRHRDQLSNVGDCVDDNTLVTTLGVIHTAPSLGWLHN